MKEKTKAKGGAPLAALTAELEACRKAIEYCLKLAMAPVPVPEDYPRPKGLDYDMGDRASLMTQAIQLMEVSGALGEAIARLNGEMRQSITVDRYEHGPGRARAPQTLSTQKLSEPRENARAIQHQGEGRGPETEKRMGE